MTKKLTKKELFTEILGVVTEPAHIEFIQHELELLSRKNTGERKPTAAQKENEVLKAAIVESMVAGERYTISELIASVEVLNGLSGQKVNSLLTQLKTAGLVVRVEEKRKAYFMLAE